ncbi:N-acetylmuramoyl-L-alanine amidase [Alkalilacustris brevis]|uniref:N-acetylmuramoyl-L-alanine amidase n=1 Tax=Alkalilacustris brevis TaxID=2026338 RepID=UPI001EE3FF17|nr:N-acetylmuramoyl-L-alanine amidase [Alkalilacustris brevis]
MGRQAIDMKVFGALQKLAAVALAALLLAAGPARAEGFSALAHVLPGASVLEDAAGGGIAFSLALSQPVPYRMHHLTEPPRLVIDFREVDFSALPPGALRPTARVPALRFGALQPGWSRMVLELDGAYALQSAGMDTAALMARHPGAALLTLRLTPTDAESFAASAAAPEDVLFGGGQASPLPAPRLRGEGPLIVVLDPGHGGIDPGAERDGYRESELMLTFARELEEALLRDGGFTAVLTRDEDVFVSLEARVRQARKASADVFLSLHADALPGGGAAGATVYTLAEEATDAAAAALAERHDRADLLAGVDLSAQDDLIANVLISMARTETTPRTDQLAEALVAGLQESVGRMHRKPRQAAGFSVLKAPDIPSVLIELGFMSNAQDLANLTDAEWRAAAAQGIVSALRAWADEDAAEAPLRRR